MPSQGSSLGLCSGPNLPFISSMTLDDSLTLSEPHFAHLCNKKQSVSITEQINPAREFILPRTACPARVGRESPSVWSLRCILCRTGVVVGGSHRVKHWLFFASSQKRDFC